MDRVGAGGAWASTWRETFGGRGSRPRNGRRTMSKTVSDWIESDVEPYQDKSVAWLSQFHFFRDPIRPTYSDLNWFFSPADGIIIYQRRVRAEEPIVEIKGKAYSLRDALRDEAYRAESLVIGIF